MSDIIAKIHGIETKDDVLALKDPLPAFVSRPTPIIPPALTKPPAQAGKIKGLILALAALWMIGAALVFGAPFLAGENSLLQIAGFAILLLLPALLLILFWVSLSKLQQTSRSHYKIIAAAEALFRPDATALDKTQTLAAGIHKEISAVDDTLQRTVAQMQTLHDKVSTERQTLNAAGLDLTQRTEDIGRNLSLQRQALEAISDTFDARMEALSTHISEQSHRLESATTDSEARVHSASAALSAVSETMGQAVTQSTEKITTKIEELDKISQKITDTEQSLTQATARNIQNLSETGESLDGQVGRLDQANQLTRSQISELQSTFEQADTTLQRLKDQIFERSQTVRDLYADMSQQITESEDKSLAAQGQTARMVEANLAQMRRDFARMETDMQMLQSKLVTLRDKSDTPAGELGLSLPHETLARPKKSSRLKLRPLETDFPPVEPPVLRTEQLLKTQATQTPKHKSKSEGSKSDGSKSEDSKSKTKRKTRRPLTFEAIPSQDVTALGTPFNLGADMELHNPDDVITTFDPELLQPIIGDGAPHKSSKKRGSNGKSDWEWQDMLGDLESPAQTPLDPESVDINTRSHNNSIPKPISSRRPSRARPFANLASKQSGTWASSKPKPSLATAKIITQLEKINLSPAAVVDDGTIIDATQAQINQGEAALAQMVRTRLPEPIAHLQSNMQSNAKLAKAVTNFAAQFAYQLQTTPSEAPALRAALGSPLGRAYLLCAAAL